MQHLTRPEGSPPEDLLLSRRQVAGGLLAGYAVAAVSADAAPVVTSSEDLVVESVTIPNGAAKPLPAYVARPAGRRARPAIIVVNEIFGLHDYIKDVCRRLAQAGYVAIAPEFFYRAGVDLPKVAKIEDIMPIVRATPAEQVDGDVRAVTAWLADQSFAAPRRIGITGFCWGGAVVWRSAMVNPAIRAGVAWYGRVADLVPRAGELKAPVLGLYASADRGIPQADVDAMNAALVKAGRPGRIEVFPGTEHGFHADYRASYNPAAAEKGWRMMRAFFRKHGV